MFAENNGTRIRYEVVGEGEPLLLHHGFTENIESWYAKGFVDALHARYRLIMIDSRGHGASDKPREAAAYSLERRTGDVLAVLDAAGIPRAHYFGYSLGGWVGFGVARDAPHRVVTLTLGGAHPYGQSMQVYREMLGGTVESLLAALEAAAKFTAPPDLRERFVRNDVEALRAAYSEDRPDISALLPSLAAPVLLFCGSDDPLRDGARRAAADLRDGRYVELPGLNHVQAGLQVARIIPAFRQFLETHRRDRAA